MPKKIQSHDTTTHPTDLEHRMLQVLMQCITEKHWDSHPHIFDCDGTKSMPFDPITLPQLEWVCDHYGIPYSEVFENLHLLTKEPHNVR